MNLVVGHIIWQTSRTTTVNLGGMNIMYMYMYIYIYICVYIYIYTHQLPVSGGGLSIKPFLSVASPSTFSQTKRRQQLRLLPTRREQMTKTILRGPQSSQSMDNIGQRMETTIPARWIALPAAHLMLISTWLLRINMLFLGHISMLFHLGHNIHHQS